MGPLAVTWLSRRGVSSNLWVQRALRGALAQAFASHMAPGDPSSGCAPVDQAMVEQALHGRVTALSRAFAYWLVTRRRRWSGKRGRKSQRP
jgi:hypothetical protein